MAEGEPIFKRKAAEPEIVLPARMRRVPPPPAEKSTSEKVGDFATTTGGAAIAGGAAGLTALAGIMLGRKMLPGVGAKKLVTKNFFKELDAAFKASDSKASLPRKFGDYMTFAANADRSDIGFLEWAAAQNDPNVNRLITSTISHSGKAGPLAQDLQFAASDSRGRILKSLATNMAVPPKSLTQTMDELTTAKKTNAAPLYDEAFKDKSPIRDSRLVDLMGRHNLVMDAALEHAKEAFKLDPSKLVESQTMPALSGTRKDAWKFPIPAKDVPDFLHVGEPRNGLQTVIAPNMETLDRMKRALWALRQKRLKDGAGDVGAIDTARRELVDLMDNIGPDAYKKARATFKGDTEMEEAAELGSTLLKAKPSAALDALSKMSPEEREAAARGFYGAIQDEGTSKLLREYVTNPARYPERRNVLSAMFQDPAKLDKFLQDLEAERMVNEASRFSSFSPTYDTGDRGGSEFMRATVGNTMLPSLKIGMFEKLGNSMPFGLPSRRFSESGLDFLTAKPNIGPRSASHPYYNTVGEFENTPGLGHDAAVYGGAGAGVGMGGLGLYDLTREGQ